MTPDELTAKYLLARILYWRDQLDGLDGAAVAQLIKVLSSAKADVLARLKADADGIASVTDWNRDRLRPLPLSRSRALRLPRLRLRHITLCCHSRARRVRSRQLA